MNGEKEVVALVQSALYAYALLVRILADAAVQGVQKIVFSLSTKSFSIGPKVTATPLMDLCEVDVQREGW